MKKFIALLLVLVLFLAACGSGSSNDATDPVEDDGRLRVVTTIFPQYDFIRQIAGDRVHRTMLIQPGAEAHSFEPTPGDIIGMMEADLFIYAGGDGELWVQTLIAPMDLETLRVVALLDMVEGLEKDHGHDHDHSHGHGHAHDHDHDDHDHDHDHDHEHNGHDYDHSHSHGHAHDHDDHDDHEHSHSHDHDDHDHDHAHDGHDHGHSHDHHHHHEPELDEHVWTSPMNAIVIVEQLTEILA